MTPANDSQPFSTGADSANPTCPFLGFHDDPEVHYSYPEAGNYCHRAKPPQSLNHRQQSEVCLAGKYRDCPLFSTDWNGPLPKELAGRPIYDGRQASFPKGWLILAVGVVVLAIIGFSANSIWPAKLIPTFTADPQVSPLPAFLPSQTPQMDPTLAVILPLRSIVQPTQTNLPPTQTLLPASSPTSGPPTPGPLQETPFGPAGRYLVHIVLVGETIENIASHYATTVEVLRAINLTANHPILYGGNPAVIVVGETDRNNVQSLKAVWIEARILLSDLVNQYAIPLEELRAMNSLGAGEWVEGKRWIIARRP